jgi:long-subunit fatty acid transport protein
MKPIPIILLFLAFCMPAAADDFLGTRPLGMGGAHRAIVTGNDSIVLNPAGMSLFRRYSFEAQYLLTPDYDGNGQEEHIFHASVIDNQLAAFATGLAYTRVQRGDNKKGNRYDMAFSLALSQNLLIGTNIKYLNFDRNFKEDATDAVTVDVGLLVRTDFGLNIGVVGYNLTNTADYLEHPISMAAAVMYSPFRTLEIAFDWFINFQRPKDLLDPVNSDKETGYSYHFGVEYLLMGQFTLRAGYEYDQAQTDDGENFWALGVGYVTQRFAFDFGYRGSFDESWKNSFGFCVRLFM